MKALAHNDEKLLCGRTEELREILENCRKERLTVITSEPGLGVTSLLQAGIAPVLRREGFIVAIFSDWQGRFFGTNLKEAIAKAVREEADRFFFARNEPLDELLANARARAGKPVALLLDQFEDYLRCQSNTILSDEFDAELARALSMRRGAFVIGMQDHALPAFERLEQHVPNVLGFRATLTRLTTDAARDAVLAEAQARALEVETNAVEALVNAPVVTSGKGDTDRQTVHPFFLKLATGEFLDSEARLKSSLLKAAAIEARGGVDRVVFESLDAVIAELGSTQVELLFRWCNILISPEKHRLSATGRRLTEYAGKLNRFVAGLLDHLTTTGILRAVELSDGLRYEISRECLTPVLRDWWDRREAAIVARRRAVFRITSLSVALSSIVLMYVVWLIFRTSNSA